MLFSRFYIIILLLTLTSCKDFNLNKNTKISKQKTIEQPINYKSIDAYPLLPECVNITNRILQKDCFYNKITSRIKNTLDNNFLTFSNDIQETVLVIINVNANGKTSVTSINLSDKIKENIPKLDSLIRVSVNKLPVLQPAIKTGIPVASEFTLPIMIN